MATIEIIPTPDDKYKVSKSFVITLEDKTRLFAYEWSAPNPKGVVYYQHGYQGHARGGVSGRKFPNEYKKYLEDCLVELNERYKTYETGLVCKNEVFVPEPMNGASFHSYNLKLRSGYPCVIEYDGGLAEDLVKAGYTVRAFDLYGHGQSHNNDTSGLKSLSVFVDHLISVIDLFTNDPKTQLRTEHDEKIPFVMVGVSMGGYLTYSAVMRNAKLLIDYGLKGVLGIGAMFECKSLRPVYIPIILPFLKGLCTLSGQIAVPTSSSRAFPWSAATEESDPLVFSQVTVKYITEFHRSVNGIDKEKYSQENIHALKDVPFLFVHNCNDYLCGLGGVIKVYEKLKALGLDVTVIVGNPFLIAAKNKDKSVKYPTNQMEVLSESQRNTMKEFTAYNNVIMGHTIIDEPSGRYIKDNLILKFIMQRI